MIHFDVMDGQFVPPITFGDGVVQGLRKAVSLPFEAHLMTLTPEAHFEAFALAGCKRIYFHAEVAPHAHRLIQRLKEMDVEGGLAINPGTPASVVEPVLGDLDAVLIMTVNPGWGGQKLIRSAFEKVRQVRAWRADIDIEVDGGIDPRTLPEAREAGANLFVVGSYLANAPSIAEGVEALKAACG